MPEPGTEPFVEPGREPYFEPGREPYFEPGRPPPNEGLDEHGEVHEHDGLIGAAAQLLLEAGDTKEAALMLDVRLLDFIRGNYSDNDTQTASAELFVDPWVVRRFDEEVQEKVLAAISQGARGLGLGVWAIHIIPGSASPGWRRQLQQALSTPNPKNQASRAPLAVNHPRADNMAFRDVAELRVYKAFKSAQETLPKHDSFTIVPNPSIRVQYRTWEPDLLITYKGRCCAVEVDGGSHRGKWASDRSRDYRLEDAGLAFVRRIDVADTTSEDELQAFVQTVLQRLADS